MGGIWSVLIEPEIDVILGWSELLVGGVWRVLLEPVGRISVVVMRQNNCRHF